jgi:hypothetical protein
MERSAVYRRALAPIMLSVGIIGIIAAGMGIAFNLYADIPFLSLWLGTAFLAIACAFYIARRQAIREKEPFWSPPTRRVAQAVAPAFIAAFLFSLILGAGPLFVFTNVLFYGCALHAAGFFMPRGIKMFAWVIIGLGCTLMIAHLCLVFFGWGTLFATPAAEHVFMGFFFGLLHLAYGAYLYLTEKRKNAA